MELMRRKYDRLETRKKELQQMTDEYERQIHSLKQAKEESNRGKYIIIVPANIFTYIVPNH